MTTNELLVIDVSLAGAKVAVNGENKVIDWDTLRAAATQDDVSLRMVYATLLIEAKAKAAAKRTLVATINNRSNTPHDYTAELYDVAGEFTSGRIVAADFGLSGNQGYAERDVREAVKTLRSKGYEVVVK